MRLLSCSNQAQEVPSYQLGLTEVKGPLPPFLFGVIFTFFDLIVSVDQTGLAFGNTKNKGDSNSMKDPLMVKGVLNKQVSNRRYKYKSRTL